MKKYREKKYNVLVNSVHVMSVYANSKGDALTEANRQLSKPGRQQVLKPSMLSKAASFDT